MMTHSDLLAAAPDASLPTPGFANASALHPHLDLRRARAVANGRVNIMQPDTATLFSMYDKLPARQCVTLRDPAAGQWENTVLSDAFFSRENIQIIQNGIRAGVYARSNRQYVVAPQDCDALKIIMRSVFLSFAANQPGHVADQVAQMNLMVLDFCVPAVYSEAQGYLKYVRDASTLVSPMELPTLATMKGSRIHMLPDWM